MVAQSNEIVVVTAREREVLLLVAQGYTDREIGVRLHLSHHTIANELRTVRLKMRARNRAHAAFMLQVIDCGATIN